MALVQLSDISKVFAGTVALDGVDLELLPGEIHALVGENGSGKSTLLRVIAGVHRQTRGTIDVDGEARVYHRPADATADGIVLVTQEGSLLPDLSVTENIFVGRLTRRRGRVDWPGMRRRARALLEQLGVDVDPKLATRALPPDQRQLVEIARALSYDSRVLLLDEPTSALDLHETERLLATVRHLAQGGMAVVFVSHRMPEIMSIGDRFTVLRDGRLIGTRQRREVDEAWLVRAMVGRDLQRVMAGPPPARTDAPVLDVRGLRDRGGRVRDVALSVTAGEIVGLSGLVGAGRTEILETIAGLRHRTAGHVSINGATLGRGVRAALASGLVLVAEDRKRQALLASRSVHENATLTLPVGGGWRRRRSQEVAVAQPLLERLEVKFAGLEQPISTLSGGNQQKVLLARAMIVAPKILLLDEPTRGVDLGAKQRIYEETIALANRGLGIVIASSELPELLALCHRVVVVREGAIAAEFQQHELTEESLVGAATGARSHARA